MMRAVFLAALATAAAEPSPDLAPATRAAVMAFVQDYKTNFADYETACKEVGATLHTALDAAGESSPRSSFQNPPTAVRPVAWYVFKRPYARSPVARSM